MPQSDSYDSAPTDGADGTESQAPSTDAFTGDSTPGATSKGGPGNWGVGARWFIFALLAIAFIVCLTLMFR
jgi:hypothetical protein